MSPIGQWQQAFYFDTPSQTRICFYCATIEFFRNLLELQAGTYSAGLEIKTSKQSNHGGRHPIKAG